MEIAGVDIATYHAWVYHKREMPPAAIERLQGFFAAALDRPTEGPQED
jgi:hypothetical protein